MYSSLPPQALNVIFEEICFLWRNKKTRVKRALFERLPGQNQAAALATRFLHFSEQNRTALDTRRPLRHFRMVAEQSGLAHLRGVASSTAAFAPCGLRTGTRPAVAPAIDNSLRNRLKKEPKGFYIKCAHCRKEFESHGLRCCSTECERAYCARQANLAVMAEAGMEPATKRDRAAWACQAGEARRITPIRPINQGGLRSVSEQD